MSQINDDNSIHIDIPSIVGRGYGKYWRFQGRYRVVKGGRASKKSKTTALNLIYRIMKYPQANAMVVRKVADTLRDSCFADLAWAARRLGVYDRWKFPEKPTSVLEAVYLPTGQKILGRGLDDPQKLASATVSKGFLCWLWLEEAYEIEKEEDFDRIDDIIRGDTGDLFKQITITFNPWSDSHWLKKRFFDADPYPDLFADTTTYLCNEWLDAADLDRFERMKLQNPARYRVAGLGEWGIDGAVFFEEFVDDPSHYQDRQHTHVIAPFEIQKTWRIYRGFDFGYAKPFSVGWWAVDHEDCMYRILEMYGCEKGQANVGVKWNTEDIFAGIKRVEEEHRWLKGKRIYGIADPSIWDASRGISIAETAEKMGVYFEPGDNKRLPGWMQVRNRLSFDENGIPGMYIFNTCRQFLRTVPVLKYDDLHPEDLDTDMEDHIADEMRYVCMARPYSPPPAQPGKVKVYDPLADDEPLDKYNFFRKY